MGAVPAKYEISYVPERKRILILTGCFCPPNKGHTNLVRRQLQNFDEIHIFISNDKYEQKNGATTETSVNMWKSFAKQLPILQRNKFFLHETTDKDVRNEAITWGIKNFPTDSDVQQVLGSELGPDVEQTYRKFYQQNSNSRPDIRWSFAQLEKSDVSTKDFVECLKKSWENCTSYMPEEFDLETKQYYQSLIRTNDFHSKNVK